MSTSANRLSNLLAWFAVVNGVLSILASVLLSSITGQPLPALAMGLFLSLGIASLVSGIYALRGRPWAFLLLFFTFLIQCAEYQSETMYASLMGPIYLKFGFGWKSPPSWLNVNILAIVVCALALRALDQMLPKSEASDA